MTVCCMLWSDRAVDKNYLLQPSHVHILKNMVERHLHVPHRFLCLTDAQLTGIETYPIDWSKHVPSTRFNKLMLYRPGMEDILGERFLYLDLDTVIVGDITPLVDRDEDIVFWRNPKFDHITLNTSIVLHRTGTRPYLWTEFTEDILQKQITEDGSKLPPIQTGEKLVWSGSSDQRWVRNRIADQYRADYHWPGAYEYITTSEALWVKGDGIYGLGGLKSGLPDDARIVFTPGNREPSQPEVQAKHLWIKEHYR